MNYSIHPHIVRLERFKHSGKWYDTLELDMYKVWDEPNCVMAVSKACELANISNDNFTLVVLEPYHRSSYPVMLPAKGLGK